MATAPAVRVVRCPKCNKFLPELPQYSVYICGGCGATLQAKKKISSQDDAEGRRTVKYVEVLRRDNVKKDAAPGISSYEAEGDRNAKDARVHQPPGRLVPVESTDYPSSSPAKDGVAGNMRERAVLRPPSASRNSQNENGPTGVSSNMEKAYILGILDDLRNQVLQQYNEISHGHDAAASLRPTSQVLGRSISQYASQYGMHPAHHPDQVLGSTTQFVHGPYVQETFDIAVQMKKFNHVYEPVAGAAPFTICSNCYELLQLPKRSLVIYKSELRLRCGACSHAVVLKVNRESHQRFVQVPLTMNEKMRLPSRASQDSSSVQEKHLLVDTINSEKMRYLSAWSVPTDERTDTVTTMEKGVSMPSEFPTAGEVLEESEKLNILKDVPAMAESGTQRGHQAKRHQLQYPFEIEEDEDEARVSVNGHPISLNTVEKAEKLAGPIYPGDYWYDYRAGFWGPMGYRCHGITLPFIEEFNYPMPPHCAGGNTGVFVNGRELHHKDLSLLHNRGLPRTPGRSYRIEISGRVWDELSGKEIINLGKLAPTVEKMGCGFGMRLPRTLERWRRAPPPTVMPNPAGFV